MRSPAAPSGAELPAPTAPHRVEARGKGHSRRGGRRGRVENAIHTTAQERQDAWTEGGQPNRTYTLTVKLDGLYGEHRGEQAGTLTVPFYGQTMRAGRGR